MFLDYKILKFYILLGSSCNFNCKYCIQEENKKSKFPIEVSDRLISFLKEKSHRDLSQDIVFYGGEPLLYLNQIKEVISELEGYNFRYQILTNGSLITEEVVKFCNENEIQVMVSWDGYNSDILRGYDSILNNKTILLLDKLIFNPVFTNLSYPLDVLNNLAPLDAERTKMFQERNINKYAKIQMVGSPLYPSREDLVRYLITDFSKLELDSQKIIDKAMNDKSSIHFEYLVRLLREFELNQKEGVKRRYNQCSTGYKVFNLDLEANLYACHNYTVKVGDVESDLFTVLDNVNKYIKPVPECKKCLIKDYCLVSCNIYLSNSKYKEYFCSFQKSFLKPFIKFIKDFKLEEL